MPEADLVITHAGHGHRYPRPRRLCTYNLHPARAAISTTSQRGSVWRGAGFKLRQKGWAYDQPVLEDVRYREAARELSASISKETGQDLAVQELEALAAKRTSDPVP